MCRFLKSIRTVFLFDSMEQALKQLPREKIHVATKFGITVAKFPNFQIKGTPKYVRSCCEASLKRLVVEYIDLYYQHIIDQTIPIEEAVGDPSSNTPFNCFNFIIYLLLFSTYYVIMWLISLDTSYMSISLFNCFRWVNLRNLWKRVKSSI